MPIINLFSFTTINNFYISILSLPAINNFYITLFNLPTVNNFNLTNQSFFLLALSKETQLSTQYFHISTNTFHQSYLDS